MCIICSNNSTAPHAKYCQWCSLEFLPPSRLISKKWNETNVYYQLKRRSEGLPYDASRPPIPTDYSEPVYPYETRKKTAGNPAYGWLKKQEKLCESCGKNPVYSNHISVRYCSDCKIEQAANFLTKREFQVDFTNSCYTGLPLTQPIHTIHDSYNVGEERPEQLFDVKRVPFADLNRDVAAQKALMVATWNIGVTVSPVSFTRQVMFKALQGFIGKEINSLPTSDPNCPCGNAKKADGWYLCNGCVETLKNMLPEKYYVKWKRYDTK